MKLNKIAHYENLSNIERITEFEVNKISDSVAKMIAPIFDGFNFNEKNIYAALTRLNMFYADFFDTNISAKYHFPSKTIFINRIFDLDCPDSILLHECIHYLQSKYTKTGKISKMGMYHPRSFKQKGLALNEAAVQLMASNLLNIKPAAVLYYDMEFTTPSPDFYPLETAIIKQMTYFTGTYPLYYSTIYSDNLFQDVFQRITNKETYNTISANLNKIIELQDNFYKADDDISKNIIRANIQKLVSITQEKIYKNAFKKKINQIRNRQDILNLRVELLNYENTIIQIPNNYAFEQFKDSLNSDLIALEVEIMEKGYIVNYNIQKSLIPDVDYGINFFKRFWDKAKVSLEIALRIRNEEDL